MGNNVDEFSAVVKALESQPDYQRPAAFALGIASFGIVDPGQSGRLLSGARILDTWYPVTNLAENYGSAAVLAQVTGYRCGSQTRYLDAEAVAQALACFAPFRADGKAHPNLRVLEELAAFLARPQGADLVPRQVVVTFIGDLAAKPVDAHDAYLRLHLLSQRKVRPHGCSLEGIFGLLANVAWTSEGPLDPETFDAVRLRQRARGGELRVRAIDKFPRMTDYVLPGGVRIADADRVRLGAHLAEGTTVMHEGFCNFNAGTLGKSMVEGRISSGVVIGNGSDIGGGASIMGTLSGGGKEVITVGEHCLLGANSGLGISLGNGCTVESGLYVTAGAKVRLSDGQVVKAAQLSGLDDLLFRRNSQNGAIEVLRTKGGGWEGLNQALHAN